MRITRDTTIRDVLAMDEERMLATLTMMSPQFDRLRYPRLRRAMAGRVTVAQAARIAKIPLADALYVLNLALGQDEAELSAEVLSQSSRDDYECRDTNPPVKPAQIAGVDDEAECVHFLDLMSLHESRIDPLPSVARGLAMLKGTCRILLIRHPFDPVPLRDLLAKRGYVSWAEERSDCDWYIYFFRPQAITGAKAHPAIDDRLYSRSYAAAA